MKRKLTSPLPCLACLLLLSTSAGAANESANQSETAARLARIEQLLSSHALLELLQQVQALEDQVKQLQGQLELQDHRLEQLKKRQRALYVDIDQRLQAGERRGASSAAAAQPGPADENPSPPLATLAPVHSDQHQADRPATAQNLTVEMINRPEATPSTGPASSADPSAAEQSIPTAPVSDPVKARADYQHAFKLLNDNLYDQSIKAFIAFMQSHPDSALSDKAQYWLAETYFVTAAYQQALTEYSNLITNYPDSQKLTQAQLKIAYAYQELGQIDAARKTLTGLIDTYPGTTVARLASERLQQLASLPQAAQADAEDPLPPASAPPD